MGSRRGAEVIVIGAGAIGCAIAWRLAQSGRSVVLLERGEPGREASWAAAGILGAQMEAHAAGPLLELQLASRALHPRLADELRDLTGIDVGCRMEGVLEQAFDEHEAAELRARFEWQRAAGLRVEWLERGANGTSPDASGIAPGAQAALLLADDGQVDARLLSRALRLAAEQAGVSIVRGEARSIEETSGQVSGVSLASEAAPLASSAVRGPKPPSDGAVRLLECERVVVAAGSWSSLVRGARLGSGAVRPVRGQMIALDSRGSPLLKSARVLACAGGYVVPRPDRILVGATVEEAGFDKSLTSAGIDFLRTIAGRLVPQLHDAPLLEQWSGLRPAPRDGLPLIGAPSASGAPAGLFVCTGHYRSGILLTPISAALIRDAVAGRSHEHGAAPSIDLAPFAPDRPSLLRDGESLLRDRG